jgi:hypothetical protein
MSGKRLTHVDLLANNLDVHGVSRAGDAQLGATGLKGEPDDFGQG